MPVCEGCGGSYEDTFSFCPYCGRAKPEPFKAQLEVEIKQKPSPDDCPLCKNSGSVQKVTAIVDSGTAESSSHSYTSGTSTTYSASSGKRIGEGYSSGSTSSHGFQQSKLAEKLSVPNPPKEPKEGQFKDYWPYVLIAPLWILSLIVIGGGSEWDMGPTLMSLVCYGPIVGIFGSYLIYSFVNSYNKSEEKYKVAKQEYARNLTRYKNAKQLWQKLYYCHKHDIVFVAGKQPHASSGQMWSACLQWGNEQ